MGLTFLAISFVVLLLLRVPIAFALGLSSIGYIYWFMPVTIPLTVVPQAMTSKPSAFPLLAVPFFILIGELMTASGISQRLVDLARALVGHLRGGLGMVALVSSALMSSFSGSSVANAVGTGSITIPAMKAEGYRAETAAAIETSSSSLGTIIPPSITMVVYGSLTGVSIGGLFVAGYLPGVVIVLALGIAIAVMARRHNLPTNGRASMAGVGRAFVAALGALAVPLIVVGGILLGLMTPTEAGAVGAVYTFLVATVFYRSLSPRALVGVLHRTALTTGVILTVIATASVLAYIMTYERIPATVADALLGGLQSQLAIMLVLVALLVVIGSFMETNAAIAIMAPVLVGITSASDLDPLFVGIVALLALSIGVATPPVGVCLFVTAKLARTTVERTSIAVLPFITVMVVVTVLMAVLPDLVLLIPRLLGY